MILAVGSLMASTGMDRLELTPQANPTIFVQSLLGIAMVGTAWVLHGAQIATGRAQPHGTVVDVLHRNVHA